MNAAILKSMSKIVFTIISLVLFTLSAGSQAYAAEKITYYHYDLLGSPIATTNELGEIIWREEYGPWGEKLLDEDAAHDNVRDYTGHVHDRETGLTYMQARYYDPQIGRFMGMDPVGFQEDNPIMFNRYAYANNNPYKFKDPNGEFAVALLAAPEVLAGLITGAKITFAAVSTTLTMAALDEVSKSILNGIMNSEVEDYADPDAESGKEMDPADKDGKLSKAGRGLQKHGSRPGSAFPSATGNADSKNKQGQDVLDGILGDPDATTVGGNRFGGVDVTSSDGLGARFDKDGKFRGFLEPNEDVAQDNETQESEI